ncbi:hypothetical protein NPX13_g5423 [Xylaria arbuscula]|uniref:RING-type domain-containing protein n=1 Tax=Xylaria arbuscula TaxID=114810 RepID=A0A9W8NEJ5_9PEZI|nr:hypothetical protein NPX13_g5423 [Xylaria arbuscula]
MEHINRALVEGAHVVARVVEYQIRQEIASTPTSFVSSVSSPTSGLSLSNTGISSMMADPTMSSMMSTPTDAAVSPTPTAEKKDGGGTGSSSPLLFFVALGFGVVFTNLWIIVGVKYCFRYNARNRAMARVDENGEPIDLQNMPARPHRRRREKKLMTMDEVNEKFPMVKYKTWVLDRKKEGLPTAGGISAPPSRANSVRSVEGIIPEQDSINRQSTDESVATKGLESDRTEQSQPKPTIKEEKKPEDDAKDATPTAEPNGNNTVSTAPAAAPTHTENDTSNKDSLHRASEDDEDDDDHINHALDPDMMGSSGDTCAICIDTLEDDDDVRGLTCGHAFHAVCLDPWLTNRRACCPLCKADYYTPKARPQPAEGEARDPNAPTTAVDPSRNNNRLNYPRTPVRSFAWSHFRDAPRQIFPSRFNDSPRDPGQMDRRYRSQQRPAQVSRRNTANQAQPSAAPEETSGNFMTRFRNRFPPFALQREMRNREAQGAGAQTNSNSGAAPPSTTPSQLEAGLRPSTTRLNE